LSWVIWLVVQLVRPMAHSLGMQLVARKVDWMEKTWVNLTVFQKDSPSV
jgi:hypothetical protein